MQNSTASSFLRPRPSANSRLRLFCFPYAGGSAAIYHQWPASLPADVELLAAQYPGRATRMREAPCKDLGLLLDDLETAIQPLLDRPYIFFGHSMGATVAFELARRLRAAHKPLPKHLFVSGRSAPHLPPTKRAVHGLPDQEFIAAIQDFNGTPAEILEHRELMEMMLPIMRADFQALETWEYQPSPPFAIPLSAFGGIGDDAVPMQNLDAWSACTTGPFKRHMFPGDHFFLHHQHAAMLNIMSRAFSGD